MDTQHDAYQNLSQAAEHMFSAEGLFAWLWLLTAIVLAALPLLIIRPADPPLATRIGKIALAALPTAWIVACIIVAAFAGAGGAASEVVFWICSGLIAAVMIAGVAAAVMIRGWHRLTAIGLLVVNLWILIACAFVGVIMVSGAVL